MTILIDDYLEVFHKNLTKKYVVGEYSWYNDKVTVTFEKKVKGFINGDGKVHKTLTIPMSNIVGFTYGVTKLGTYKEWKKQNWVKKLYKDFKQSHDTKTAKDWCKFRYIREFCLHPDMLDDKIISKNS